MANAAGSRCNSFRRKSERFQAFQHLPNYSLQHARNIEDRISFHEKWRTDSIMNRRTAVITMTMVTASRSPAHSPVPAIGSPMVEIGPGSELAPEPTGAYALTGPKTVELMHHSGKIGIRHDLDKAPLQEFAVGGVCCAGNFLDALPGAWGAQRNAHDRTGSRATPPPPGFALSVNLAASASSISMPQPGDSLA